MTAQNFTFREGGVNLKVESVGCYLKEQRQLKNISVVELARVTRIPIAAIESIESDKFDALPGEVFARGFLKAFAVALGLPPDGVLSRYADANRSETPMPIPVAPTIQTATAAPHGRRFGVAIAFVLLLILFTLALSIVLKPRGHDMPSELSLGISSEAVHSTLS